MIYTKKKKKRRHHRITCMHTGIENRAGKIEIGR